MYVYIYIYVYLCIYVCMCIYIYVRISVYMYVRIYVCMSDSGEFKVLKFDRPRAPEPTPDGPRRCCCPSCGATNFCVSCGSPNEQFQMYQMQMQAGSKCTRSGGGFQTKGNFEGRGGGRQLVGSKEWDVFVGRGRRLLAFFCGVQSRGTLGVVKLGIRLEGPPPGVTMRGSNSELFFLSFPGVRFDPSVWR